MKKILIAIAATAAITSLCWHVALGIHTAVDRLWVMSAVKAPGRMALEEIDTDLQRGDVVTAMTKLQILKAEWGKFEAEQKLSGDGIGNIMVEFSHLPPQKSEK